MPERRENKLSRFYTNLVDFYTEEVLWGFLPCGFLEENLCVLCVALLVVLLVILLLKIFFKILSKQLRKLNTYTSLRIKGGLETNQSG